MSSWRRGFLGLLVLLAGQTVWAEQAADSTSRLTVRLQVPEGGPELYGAVALLPADREGEPRVLPIRGEITSTFEVPAGSLWTVDLDLRGYWAARKAIAAPGPGESMTVRLDLEPTGTLKGSIRLADPDAPRPDQILVRSVPKADPRSGERVPRGSVSCPVSADGSWVCELPAATLDLVLSADGFVPHYRWGQTIRPWKETSWKPLTLEKGNSLAGWARTTEGKPATGVAVSLLPAVPGGGDVRTAVRLRELSFKTKTDEEGFFQLTGIPSGQFVVEGRTGQDFGRAGPIEVWEGGEAQLLDPLILRPPLDLQFTLEPAKDWQGRPWRLALHRLGETGTLGARGPLFDGSAGEEGRVEVRGQFPGIFYLQVFDFRDNLFHADAALATLGPEEASRVIEIGTVLVEGEVTFREWPIAATVWLGGRRGAPRVEVSTNHEGWFQAVLPRGGLWRVDAETADSALETRTRVTITPDADGQATIEIPLPDTEIFGRVLDERGEPEPRARVKASGVLGPRIVTTEPDGTFVFRGVAPGDLHLSATASRAEGSVTSTARPIELGEDATVGPIVLELIPSRAIHGQVRSTHGPVAGAVIQVGTPTFYGYSATVRTEIDGTYHLQVPATAGDLLWLVSPPGHAYQAFLRPAEDNMILDVDSHGGDLRVRIDLPLEELERRDARILVTQNGLPLSTPSLLRWAAGNDRRATDTRDFVLPRMAPGHYEVCLGPKAVRLEPGTDWPKSEGANCREGYLAPGGNLELRLGRSGRPQESSDGEAQNRS